MSPTGRKPAPKSEAGKGMLENVRNQVTDYEAAFGALPIWLRELDPAQALPLMASLLRIGLKLPPQELLREDLSERDIQRARGVSCDHASPMGAHSLVHNGIADVHCESFAPSYGSLPAPRPPIHSKTASVACELLACQLEIANPNFRA